LLTKTAKKTKKKEQATMSRIAMAWRILTSAGFAQHVTDALAGRLNDEKRPATSPPTDSAVAPALSPARSTPAGRSEAVTLLATLQREGRLIDFLKEPLDGYNDAQVGAAVRDIHRDCSAVLERQFGIRPLVEQPEGSRVEIGVSPDPARYKLTGSAASSSVGRLLHHGWQIARCDVPQWTGSRDSSTIISPAEVDLGNP
jgi:hypothetical protein